MTRFPTFIREGRTLPTQEELDREFADLVQEADRNGHFNRPPGDRPVDRALDSAQEYVHHKHSTVRSLDELETYIPKAVEQPVVLSPDAAKLLNAGIMAGAKAAADALVAAARELEAKATTLRGKAERIAEEILHRADEEGNRIANEFHKLVEFDGSMQQVWDKYRGIPDG